MSFRRRIMMMAEKPLTPIERLKQLGCLMWFPLNSANQGNDIIGGRTLITDTARTITYQTNYTQFTYTLNRIGHIDISDLAAEDFVVGGFTTFFQARRLESSSLRGGAACWQCNGTYIGFSSDGTTANTASWTDDLFHCISVVRHQDGTREIYHNGVMYNNTNATYPDIWNYGTIDVKANNSNNKRIYAKNFLLFNKALTAAEVAEVYQIINQ